MIVSIIRVAVVNSNEQNADISWLYLWSNIEMATCMCSRLTVAWTCFANRKFSRTAVIIASLASFRQLFVKEHQQHNNRAIKSTARSGLLSYFRSGDKSSVKPTSSRRWPIHFSKNLNLSDSRTHIVPLESIHVSTSINVSNPKLGYERVWCAVECLHFRVLGYLHGSDGFHI